MYLTQERNLKFHKLQAVFSLLPPIQRLELVVGRLLVAGFGLLTVGLAIGALGLTHLQNPQAFRTDPKVLWSALVWLLYLGLILMRWVFDQTGRRFALGALGSFAFVLLTFWGTNALPPCTTMSALPTGLLTPSGHLRTAPLAERCPLSSLA
jgi:ABC-type uncharacterized transport system permease subunit